MAAPALSDKQVAACMAPNAAWAHAAADDGWVRAHDALRSDMHDLHAALDTLAAQASADRALTAWQVRTRRAMSLTACARRLKDLPCSRDSRTCALCVTPPQVKTLKGEWTRFQTAVHFHHEHEETLVFPLVGRK
jgi:hypothetical protein